jgi:predicted nucleic acid-binding protein
MLLYLDTSALAKRYILELESPQVHRWLKEADLLSTSIVTRAEMAAIIGRVRRMSGLTEASAMRILVAFRDRWPTYVRLPVTEKTVSRADELAWQYGLRGYDAVHLASAVLWQEALGIPVTLATYDRQLWDAATLVGLRVLPEA